MQMNRAFEIVYLLMNKKCITAKQLAQHFEVSQRTIYRDIERLCEAGIPIYMNKGKGGRIFLMENFVLNKSLLSEQEQKDILSALSGLKATNYPEADQVLSKLTSLFGNSNPDWIEVDFSNWNSKDEDRQNFNLLKQAILNRKVIQFDYFNSYGEETHRNIEPNKIYFRGQAWYLFGYCRVKKDYRYFKLTRIQNLKLEDEYFTPRPINKSPMNATPEIKTKPQEMELKIDSNMAFRVFDEFPKEAITTQEDGSFLIHTSLPLGNWLYGYLISYQDHLEVIRPEYIRTELANICNHILTIYQKNKPTVHFPIDLLSIKGSI